MSSELQSVQNSLFQRVRVGQAKSAEVVEHVLKIVKNSTCLTSRYFKVNVVKFLQDNCQAHVTDLAVGLGILEKYGKNLIKDEKPPQWRVVRFSNQIFHSKVDTIQGARDILNLMGYTTPVRDGLSFPNHVIEPDINNVVMVTSDIILLKFELLLIDNAQHPKPQDINSYRQPPRKMSSPAVKASSLNIRNTTDTVLRRNIGSPPTSPTMLDDLCVACGQKQAELYCKTCDNKQCKQCDKIWHQCSNRLDHVRIEVTQPSLTLHGVSTTVQRTSHNNQPNQPNNGHVPQQTAVRQTSYRPGQGYGSTSEDTWEEKINKKVEDFLCISDENKRKEKVYQFCSEIETQINVFKSGASRLSSSSSITKHLSERASLLDSRKNEMLSLFGLEDPHSRRSSSTSLNVDEDRIESPSFHQLNDTTTNNPHFAIKHQHAPTIQPTVFNNQHISTRNQHVEATNVLGLTNNQHTPTIQQVLSTNQHISTRNQHVATLYQHPSRTNQHFQHGPSSYPPTLSTIQQIPSTKQHVAATNQQTPPSYQHFPLKYQQNQPNNQQTPPSIATPPPTSHYSPHHVLVNNENSSNFFHEVRGPPEVCYLPDSFDKLLTPSGPNSTEPKHLNNSQTDNFAAKTENRQPASEIRTHYQCEDTLGQESDNFSLPALHDDSYTQDIEVFPTYDQVVSCVDVEPSSMNTRELEQQTKKEDIRFNCSLMVAYLREAQREGFSPKQVEIAIKQLKTSNNNTMNNPVQWLKRNWMDKVESLTAQHPLFNVEELSELLVESEFNENELNAKLELRKLAKIEAVNGSGDYLVDDYERYLLDHRGNVTQTIRELQQQLLQSIYRRLRAIEQNETKITDFIQITEETRAKNALASYFLCDNDIILSMIYRILHSNITEVEDYLYECNIDDIMEAARSFPDDYEAAVKFLENECKICFKNFPKSKIECMPTCTDIECKYCRGCLHEYLRHKINETPRYVRHIVCPVCLQPDMDEDGESVENYLNHLDALIRRGLDDETYQLFQKKLRDQTLMKMPNFRWCAHCVNGFLYEQQENNLKMVCSACGKATCYDCKKPWEDQHEGISCIEFQQWKEMNDPDSQAAGLAAHLKEHGIDCPNCKFRYALSKGGCMHFKCSTCSFEFCRGCKGSFKQGRRCTLFRTCQNKGLHAHHPRDCLFYLRDLEIERLQKILQDGEIPHRTECTISNNTCQVMEQQETPDGLIDACCGGEVHENNADLCEVHYKEYLVILINKNHLDPATVFTGDELETCLHREEHPMPHKQDMNDVQYHEKLLSIVCTYPLIHAKLQMQQ
ncbi:E3 ubiquitin-protein ligase RNF31 [Ciona intestinalis]